MILRTLIADDEAPARVLLRTLLKTEPSVQLLGECCNGDEAVEFIKREKPDLLFLDIQMPGCDGFEVLRRCLPEHSPRVVFVTAFDEHAVRAFEVSAIDYILKPFAYERIHEAVRRALEIKDPGTQLEQLMRLLESLSTPASWEWDRLVARDEKGLVFVRPAEVDWAEAEGNYMRLHVGPAVYLVRETMQRLEARLATRGFLRISRSTLVNLDRVRSLQPLFHGDSVVLLKDGTKLTLTRGYREAFDRLVSGMQGGSRSAAL